MTLLSHTLSRLRGAWFAAHGARFGPNCRFEHGVSVELGLRDGHSGVIRSGARCEFLHGVCLHAWGGRIALADRVFIGPYAVLYGHGGIEIGANTLVSMHCRILSSNHTVPPAGTDIRSQPDLLLPTKIGRDAWLGAGVTILGGVTIGDGCVVGAGAVVTRDLPPQTIAVGVPATVIRSRT